MTDHELNRALSAVPDLVPSSGFALSVMDAVREAAMPAPIPLPWKRLLPGLAAWAIALAAMLWMTFTRFTQPAEMPQALSSLVTTIVTTAVRTGLPWIALALLLSSASMSLSARLSRGTMNR